MRVSRGAGPWPVGDGFASSLSGFAATSAATPRCSSARALPLAPPPGSRSTRCSPTRSRTSCRNPWTPPASPPGARTCPRMSRRTPAAISTTNFGPARGWQRSRISKIEVSQSGDQLTLSAKAVMQTKFMRIFGHDTVTVAATTTVDRTIRQMELALVLDNTGSMAGADVHAMQAAAKDLVNILYGSNDTNPNLYVAVVPFVSVVNIGANRWIGWCPLTCRRICVGRHAQPLRAQRVEGLRDGPHRRPRPDRRPTGGGAVLQLSVPQGRLDNDCASTKRPGSTRSLVPGNNGYGPEPRLRPGHYPAHSKEGRRDSRRSTAWAPGAAAAPPATRASRGAGACCRPAGAGCGVETHRIPVRLDYKTANTDKVAVILTDGDNQVYDWLCQWKSNSSTPDCPGSTRCTLYWSERFRLHWVWSAVRFYAWATGTPAQQTAQGKAEFDKRMTNICTQMKSKGIIIYTITFGRPPSASAQKPLQSLRHQARNTTSTRPTKRICARSFAPSACS